MVENQFKTIGFILKVVLLLQLVYVTNIIHNQHQFGEEANQSDVYDRLSKIEAQNQRHEKEILLLKTEKGEDKKEIRQLRERVALLESSTFSNSSEGNLKRSKRPARLLPQTILRPRKKNNQIEGEETINNFYGPPTSCEELQKLKYTLNGYYLIKGKEKLNGNRIQIVYCRFYQPPGAKKSFETLIGNVEVKTKSVQFYVQRNKTFKTTGTLTYNVEQLNIGGAMDLKTGKFTAPVNGTYHFEFRCLKDKFPNETGLFLLVNQKKPLTVVSSVGVPAGQIVASTYMVNVSYYFPGSITASLKLRASDIVQVYWNSFVYLHDNGAHYTQFAGWLVEEELILA